jgi:hypothetical protein
MKHKQKKLKGLRAIDAKLRKIKYTTTEPFDEELLIKLLEKMK